jgi:ABC-type uncharacterized transport system permease subunit
MLIDHKIWVHLLSAGLAVSVFCLAGVQAILLNMQEKQLRNKHVQGIMKILPPLETMEIFLFQLIGCGFCLLTLVLVTSLYFFSHEMLTVYLLSKTLIVVLAWVFFAILLLGRHWFGLRGKRAIYGTLSGVVLLIVIYCASLFLV